MEQSCECANTKAERKGFATECAEARWAQVPICLFVCLLIKLFC
jgi:hypothetical protein